MNFLLGTSYAGNLDYFSCIKNSKNIAIDLNEFFHKQSFKNRCQIYGANGLLNLTVPIQRKPGRNPVKDIKIEYSFNWQKVHWKSLESSYRSSPYFEYYEHYFFSFYKNEKPKFLIDFKKSGTSSRKESWPLSLVISIKPTSAPEAFRAITISLFSGVG